MTRQAKQRARKINSLRSRLEAFFRDNPEERLTIKDMTIKFDCKPGSLRSTLARLREEEVLESEHSYGLKAAA